MIEITERQINRINSILTGKLQGKRGAVYYNAVNRALATANSEINKGIRKTYYVSSGTINKYGERKIKKAGGSEPIGSIKYSGVLLPLFSFKVSPKEHAQRMTVAQVMKEGSGSRLEHAFIADLGHGKGVFERLTRKRESSEELYGPSVAHMAGNEGVIERAETVAEETLDKRIEHEIERILNGYGG